MNELKPCPFCPPDTPNEPYCRETEESSNCFTERDGYQCEVVCDCGASKAGSIEPTIKKALVSAIEAWNTRYEQTCRIEKVKDGLTRGWWHCFYCGGFTPAPDEISYCPYCGFKVAEVVD